MDEVAPVHGAQLLKVAENDLVHATQPLDLVLAVGVRSQERHLPSGHDRGRMLVKGEHRRDAADLMALFQHRYLITVPEQLIGSRQPRRARADNQNLLHIFLLS